MVKKFLVFGVFGAVAIAIACADNPGNPASPSVTNSLAAAAGPAGETLKASAPSLVSPINSQRVGTLDLTLVVGNATTTFASDVALSYRFQIFNAAGAQVHEGTSNTTSYAVPVQLEGDQTYTWQARAEAQGAFGPWSSRGTFIAEAVNGYIRGNELYDPLINGKTIGTVHGPVTFIPGLGVKLESQLSYISYQLEQTLVEGEFSIITTGMPANTEGDKTKLFAMAQGYDDIVTNDRRMTVEKRGNPPGVIAWRFLTHDDRIDTEGADRVPYDFKENLTYFWQATWRANRFNLQIRENNTNGVDGRVIYDKGKNWNGAPYDPNPHVIYIGSPIGRSGPDSASVDHVTIRHVWVSNRPRPASANR